MRDAASYFRQKADLCRELAEALGSHDDPVVLKLRAMADEWDGKAGAPEQRLSAKVSGEPGQAGTPYLH
ncbi:hypothetical protein [Methylorubrum aminovorans]|uniref:hypothetical protein n=1 Tax=Methylorubrum aminovorans TaxID=269069 RepID=UPI001EDF8457|nr:hypothetical protein [Methylorubrum aminovorans]GMA74351.1 hypothetical protein GCM10025880_07680 [Methylorubrum aminovorans]